MDSSTSPGVTPTASPAVDTSSASASRPSDTGAASQSAGAAQTRGPIPYERWEQYQRTQKQKEAEWQRERADLLARVSRPDPTAAQLNKLLLERLQPKEPTYDDPVEAKLEELRKQVEGRFADTEKERASFREFREQVELERMSRSLEQEYRGLLTDPRYSGIAAFAQSEHGQKTLSMFLAANPQASVADGFDYIEALRHGFTPAQAQAQATGGAASQKAAGKPPVLDTPGAGGAATRTNGKPRTMEEARLGLRAALKGFGG